MQANMLAYNKHNLNKKGVNMGGIPIHFEPNILGCERIWCTVCGCVVSPENAVWRTTMIGDDREAPRSWVMVYPKEGSKAKPKRVAMPPTVEETSYQWIKDDSLDKEDVAFKPHVSKIPVMMKRIGETIRENEDSPHSPYCPNCGCGDIVGEAVHDGFVLRMKGEPHFYPRRLEDDGINRKPFESAWLHVKPYMTKPWKGKKGHMSEWRKQTAAELLIMANNYDAFQQRASMIFEGDDLDGNLDMIRDLYEKVSYGIYTNLSTRKGLVIIRERKHWPSDNRPKLGMRPNYFWGCEHDLRKGDKVRVFRKISDELRVKAWVRVMEDKNTKALFVEPCDDDELIIRDGLIRIMRWEDLAKADEWLNARYPKGQGDIVPMDGGLYFWDCHTSEWVEIAKPRISWCVSNRKFLTAQFESAEGVTGYSDAIGADADAEPEDEEFWQQRVAEGYYEIEEEVVEESEDDSDSADAE